MASFYLRRRELDDTPVNGTTEKEDLEKLADWVEEHGVFQDTKGLLRATNTDLDLQLKRLFQRPGVCDDVCPYLYLSVKEEAADYDSRW